MKKLLAFRKKLQREYDTYTSDPDDFKMAWGLWEALMILDDHIGITVIQHTRPDAKHLPASAGPLPQLESRYEARCLNISVWSHDSSDARQKLCACLEGEVS